VLGRDKLLAPFVKRRPGLRVPGAIDPFEASIRALLGQQVSVAAATTLAGRFAAQLGAPIALLPDSLRPGSSRANSRRPNEAPGSSSVSSQNAASITYRFPTPREVVAAGVDRIAKLGLPGKRAAAIHNFARVIDRGDITLDAAADLDAFTAALDDLPGIGPWTAHYLAMRALHVPDAFPAADLGVQKALQRSGAKAAEARAEAWRPFRAYAVMHLWTSLGGG